MPPEWYKIAWSSVKVDSVGPLMDCIIHSFYSHGKRGQSVWIDKSKFLVIFHTSTRHMHETNAILWLPGEIAPPRPTAKSLDKLWSLGSRDERELQKGHKGGKGRVMEAS